MSDPHLTASALYLDLSTARKMVLVALCENADFDTGYNFAGQEDIAFRAGLTSRAVRDHLKAMEGIWFETKSVGHGPGSITERYVYIEKIIEEGRRRHDEFKASRQLQARQRRAYLDKRTVSAQLAGLARPAHKPANPSGINAEDSSGIQNRKAEDSSGLPKGAKSPLKPEDGDTKTGRLTQQKRKIDALKAEAPRIANRSRTDQKNGSENRSDVVVLWKNTVERIRQRVTAANYDTWLRGTRGLHMDGETLVVAVSSALAADWLSTRMKTVIQQSLVAEAGTSIGLRFEVQRMEEAG